MARERGRSTRTGLWIGGVSAVDLAERYGTPLLVVDEDDLRTRMRAAVRAFPKRPDAVKAFTAHAMVRVALDEGLDLLAASGGEVEACRAGRSAIPPGSGSTGGTRATTSSSSPPRARRRSGDRRRHRRAATTR